MRDLKSVTYSPHPNLVSPKFIGLPSVSNFFQAFVIATTPSLLSPTCYIKILQQMHLTKIGDPLVEGGWVEIEMWRTPVLGQ
ncbi:MAG: hypothetical protein WCH01_09665 [Methylococcaceae bacterium]